MVLHHLRPGYLSNVKRPTAKAIFRFFRDAGEDAISVLLLSLADQRATRGPLTTAYDQRHHEEIVWSLVEQYFSKKNEKPKVRLLSGYDLIKKLKLSPSPLFKKILTAVDEEQALGRIKSKQQALEIAKRMVTQ
jgi:poly(A) polymerase